METNYSAKIGWSARLDEAAIRNEDRRLETYL